MHVLTRSFLAFLYHGFRYRVVLFGDAGTGKTALVSQFMTSEYMHTYDASLGKFEGRLLLFDFHKRKKKKKKVRWNRFWKMWKMSKRYFVCGIGVNTVPLFLFKAINALQIWNFFFVVCEYLPCVQTHSRCTNYSLFLSFVQLK